MPVIVAAGEAEDFKITAAQLDAAITDRTKVFMLIRPATRPAWSIRAQSWRRSPRYAAAATFM